MDIRVKRAYEPAAPDDGWQVLVDRLWPRGLTKEALQVDLWLKEIAPSDPLRRWFGHDAARWAEFRERYFGELDSRPDLVELILEQAAAGPVTLVYSAKDEAHNQAVALRDYLMARLKA